MKLFSSPTSPFVRKVWVTAHELGLSDRITALPSAAHPVNRDSTVVTHNPLGKVPTLLLDDGTMLADSRVICEYLNDLADADLFPRERQARWRALVDQALGDGLLDAALLARYERTARPAELAWQGWVDSQTDKIASTLATIEARAKVFDGRVDIGTITLGCALGYLDLRFAELDWRQGHPATAAWLATFEARPSMQATHPR